MGNTTILHGKRRVARAGWIAVFVISDFFEIAFISKVVRNQSLGKMKVIQQHPIGFDGIKRRIAQKSIRMEVRVQEKKSESTGFREVASPMDLSSSGRIRFLFYRHFRMSCFKVIIQKRDMPDDTQTIGKDGKFIRITEMSVDVLLLCVGTGCRL